MIEIIVIALVVAAAILLPWVSQWDPELLLLAVATALNLINLAMTIINLLQAHRRNPRFLDAWFLGAVQIAVGIALVALFRSTLGDRPETWWTSLPFLASGFLVLLRRAFR